MNKRRAISTCLAVVTRRREHIAAAVEVACYLLCCYLTFWLVNRMLIGWGGGIVRQVVRGTYLTLAQTVILTCFVTNMVRACARMYPGAIHGVSDCLLAVGIYVSGLRWVFPWLPTIIKMVTCLAVAAAAVKFFKGRSLPSLTWGVQAAYIWGLSIAGCFFIITCVFITGELPLATTKTGSLTIAKPTMEENSWAASCLIEQKVNFRDHSIRNALLWCEGVERVEAEELGLLDELPTLEIRVLSEGTLGSYERSSNTISLDPHTIYSVYFDTPTAIQTIAHEMAHAYQHRAVEGTAKRIAGLSDLSPTEEHIAQWADEMEDYRYGDDTRYSDYANQTLESSARLYAEDRAEAYMAYLYDLKNRDDS